jgi:hypothetical protein
MCNHVEVNKFFVGEKDISNGAVFGVSVLVPEITVIPTINSLISLLESKWGPNMEALDQSFDILECTKLSSI